LLAHYLRPHLRSVCLLVFCLLASAGIQLFIPQLVRAFIDLSVAGADPDELARLGIAYVCLSLLIQVFAAAAAYTSADIGWKATNRLRVDLLRHALHFDSAYFQNVTPGQMIERIDGDAASVVGFLSHFVARVSVALLVTIGVLALLWREHRLVGLTLTLFTAITMATLHMRRAVAVGPTQQERASAAQVTGFIEERLAGLDDIRTNGAGPYMMRSFDSLQQEWYARSLTAWWLRGTIWFSTSTMFAVGYILTFALGVRLYLAEAVTLGTVYLLFHYLSMLSSPLDEITQQFRGFQHAAAGMRRARELLDTPRAVISGSRSLNLRPHSLEFENVCFRYSDVEVLTGLNFRLEPGMTLGLLGRTGSGKTTLIRLASRLYDATEGRILVDGLDIKCVDLRQLRNRVALVTQDVHLFNGTIRDNLTFFDSAVRDDGIWAALEELNLRPWIRGLPHQLNTTLGPAGRALSAGQSQLLALARAFLRNPGLVILDEPSSRVDPLTERLTRDAIRRLLKGRTGIVIAHRLATVERLDSIMVLAGGRIVEYDRRDALAADPRSRYSGLLRAAAGATLDESLQGLV